MKKVVRLKERDLSRIVKRIMTEQRDIKGDFYSDINSLISEQENVNDNIMETYGGLRFCKPGDSGTLVSDGVMYGLSDSNIKMVGPYCKLNKPKV
jgi:hypothetical protein